MSPFKNKNGRRQTLAYANIPCFGQSRDEGDVKLFPNREQGMWGFTLAIMVMANSKEWASFRPPSLMIWFCLPYVKELGSTNILWVELTSHIAVHSRVGSEWYILQSYSLVGMCWKFLIRWRSLVREVSITSSVQLNTISIQLWLHLQYWWGPLGSPFSYISWAFLLCSGSKRWNLCL